MAFLAGVLNGKRPGMSNGRTDFQKVFPLLICTLVKLLPNLFNSVQPFSSAIVVNSFPKVACIRRTIRYNTGVQTTTTNREATKMLTTICGIEFDTAAYSTAMEFASDVWSTVFAQWDAIGPTDNAVKFANESQAMAEWFWKKHIA